MREAGEQMYFEDLPNEEEKKELLSVTDDDPVDCNYCYDADVPCMYCRRGRERAPTLKELGREKNQKKVS